MTNQRDMLKALPTSLEKSDYSMIMSRMDAYDMAKFDLMFDLSAKVQAQVAIAITDAEVQRNTIEAESEAAVSKVIKEVDVFLSSGKHLSSSVSKCVEEITQINSEIRDVVTDINEYTIDLSNNIKQSMIDTRKLHTKLLPMATVTGMLIGLVVGVLL